MNEEGKVPGLLCTVAQVLLRLHAVVVWLVSHGADPNGVGVMYDGSSNGTAGILQLLIDAGGDVNRKFVVSDAPWQCGVPVL